jgi:hypothetical protein
MSKKASRPGTHPRAWQEAMAEISAAVTLARKDRDTARQLLALLTIGFRTLDRFEEKRAWLFVIGIPLDSFPAPANSAATTSPESVPASRAPHTSDNGPLSLLRADVTLSVPRWNTRASAAVCSRLRRTVRGVWSADRPRAREHVL